MTRALIAVLLFATPAAAGKPAFGFSFDPGVLRLTGAGNNITADLGAQFWWGPLGITGSYRFPWSDTAGDWQSDRESKFVNADAKAVEPAGDKAMEIGLALGFAFMAERDVVTEFHSEAVQVDRTEKRWDAIRGEFIDVHVTGTEYVSTPSGYQSQQGLGRVGVRGGLYHWGAGLDLTSELGETDVIKTATGSYNFLSLAYANVSTTALYGGLFYANFYGKGINTSTQLFADVMVETSSTAGPIVTASGADPGVTEFPYHRAVGWRVGGQFTGSPYFHMRAEGGYRPGYMGGYLQLSLGWGFLSL